MTIFRWHIKTANISKTVFDFTNDKAWNKTHTHASIFKFSGHGKQEYFYMWPYQAKTDSSGSWFWQCQLWYLSPLKFRLPLTFAPCNFRYPMLKDFDPFDFRFEVWNCSILSQIDQLDNIKISETYLLLKFFIYQPKHFNSKWYVLCVGFMCAGQFGSQE